MKLKLQAPAQLMLTCCVFIKFAKATAKTIVFPSKFPNYIFPRVVWC